MRLATIPPGAPFLRTLVDACLGGIGGVRLDEESRDFSRATIYVPTRRAARALAHAFADRVQPRAVLLPRIVPLGDPSDIEQEAALLPEEGAGLVGDLPPAIQPLRRRLLLTKLVEAWRTSEGMSDLAAAGDGFSIGADFADSFALAGDLARVIDEGLIDDVDWGRLRTLVEGPFDEYFRQTRTFLEIATRAWPAELDRRGLIDEADRRKKLLRAEAERLKRHPPSHPVIAAGSTGTMPATADLLAAIARLPQGIVVLPGLDLEMPETDWDLVAADESSAGQPGHPQGALKRLLARLGVRRGDVIALGEPVPALASRTAAIAAAGRPADATDGWIALREALAARLDDGLAGVALIEAGDEREEALAIAVALREVLEDPARTAALVTPDRALADRVATELGRWGVDADDSAGRPLDRTPLGILSGLVLNAVTEDFAPLAVLALLAGPCIRWPGGDPAPARAALELLAFRGVTARPGLDGLASALDGAEDRRTDRHAHPALKRLPPEALEHARALLGFAVAALRPIAAMRLAEATVSEFAALHEGVVSALAGDRAGEGPDGAALARLFDTLVAAGQDTRLGIAGYAAVMAAEARQAVVPPDRPAQGRIHIWGLLEARLLTADRIILGGLNEGIWPPAPKEDALLNRAMRTRLGLPLPERRIGQSAHDFAQMLGAPEAFISRARTVEGEPKVASRLLRRFTAFAGKARTDELVARGRKYVSNARFLDDGHAVAAAGRPNPMPDSALQPLTLSVTDGAILQRDPYAIYARDVLGLRPLDEIDPPPDASDRGTIIHDALEAFVKEIATGGWPADPLARLLEIGRAQFHSFGGDENVRAFWWPVFETAAGWVIGVMQERQPRIVEVHAEVRGKMAVPLRDGSALILRGRADLVERKTDGTLSVTDYKTGRVPGMKEVKTGLQPQLTLMAAMAMAGAIEGVARAEVSEIRYVKLGRDSRDAPVAFKADETPLQETATRALETLRGTMSDLRAGKQGFLSRRRQHRQSDVGDYDHLARAAEWMAAGAEEEEPSQE